VLKKRRESGAFFNFKSFMKKRLNAKSAKVSQRKEKKKALGLCSRLCETLQYL